MVIWRVILFLRRGIRADKQVVDFLRKYYHSGVSSLSLDASYSPGIFAFMYGLLLHCGEGLFILIKNSGWLYSTNVSAVLSHACLICLICDCSLIEMLVTLHNILRCLFCNLMGSLKFYMKPHAKKCDKSYQALFPQRDDWHKIIKCSGVLRTLCLANCIETYQIDRKGSNSSKKPSQRNLKPEKASIITSWCV